MKNKNLSLSQPKEPINKHLQRAIIPHSIVFTRDKCIISDIYTKTYTIYQYSTYPNYFWLEKISNCVNDSILSVHIKDIDESNVISKLSAGIKTAKTILITSNDAFELSNAKRNIADNENIIDFIQQNIDRLVEVSIEIMIRAENEEELKSKCSQFVNMIAALGFVVRPLTSYTNEVYEMSSPIYPTNDAIFDSTKQLMPFSSLMKGFLNASSNYIDENGYALCKTLDGQVIFFNSWNRNKEMFNSNIILTGNSGIGKSTVAKYIILSEWALGFKGSNINTIIIDAEREYKELTENIKGKWINTLSSQGRINPLQIIVTNTDNDEQELSSISRHIQCFQTFLKTLFNDINDIQLNYVSNILQKLYSKFEINRDTNIDKLESKNYPILTDLYNLMNEEDIFTDTDDYRLLLEYIYQLTYGNFAEIWNGYSTLDYDSDFICLDTSCLNDGTTPNVQKAQYYLLLTWAWNVISKDTTTKTRLVIDEAHLLVNPKIPETMSLLKSIQKRARKYEGATLIISQDVNDFVDQNVQFYGKSLIELTAVKIVMGTTNIKQTSQVYNLNEQAEEFLNKQQRGRGILCIGNTKFLVDFNIPDCAKNLIGNAGR